LGKTEYGIWIAICQTVSFLGLSDFGVGNAIGRLVARSRGLGDNKMLTEVYSTAVFLLAGSTIIAAVISLSISPWIGNILKLDNTYAGLATKVFLITALSQILQLPMKISMGVLTGHQLYGPHAVGKILTPLLHLGGVLFLFAFHKINIIALASIDAAASIVGQLVLLTVAWRLTRPWNISLANFSKKTVSDIASIGTSAIVGTASNTSYRAGLSILLARMVNINAVGVYSVALTIIENIQPLISSLSTPFSTIASELQAQGRLDELRRSANTVTCITFAISIGVVICLYFYSMQILELLLCKSSWTFADYQQAHSALTIMSIGLAFGLPQIISSSILRGTGKHWYVSNALLISSIFSIITSFLLLKMGIGIIATAIGWSLVWFLQGVVFFPRIISRFLGQSVWEMIRKCYFPGLWVGIATFAAALFSTNIIQSQRIVPLLAKLFFTGITLIGSIVLFCGFREKVWTFISSRVNKKT
jgi:O-antigen/teichoic acid export membrane protein